MRVRALHEKDKVFFLLLFTQIFSSLINLRQKSKTMTFKVIKFAFK